ncbi:MAG: heterodisulfide reductase-related iron-sulfur binding cluster [Candidatus Thorarchaeota archaeon]
MTFTSVMHILELAFTLIKEEWCFGSIGLRIGDSVSITDIIKHNVEAIKETEAKILFTTCAGCFRTILLLRIFNLS